MASVELLIKSYTDQGSRGDLISPQRREAARFQLVPQSQKTLAENPI